MDDDVAWSVAGHMDDTRPPRSIEQVAADAIRALYERVFTGSARVWVEFGDIVEFWLGKAVIFAGREKGEFAVGAAVIPLAIRTSRVFAFSPGVGWRQVHHHGSIDDPEMLRSYQEAVRG